MFFFFLVFFSFCNAPKKDLQQSQSAVVNRLGAFLEKKLKYKSESIELLHENDTFNYFQVIKGINLILRNKNVDCDSCNDKIIINGYQFPLQNLSQYAKKNKHLTFIPLESYVFKFNKNNFLIIGLEDDYSGVRKFNSFNLIFNITNSNDPKIVYANWSYEESLMNRVGLIDDKLSLLEYQFNDTIKVYNFNGERFIEMKQKWIFGKMNSDEDFIIDKLKSNWDF